MCMRHTWWSPCVQSRHSVSEDSPRKTSISLGPCQHLGPRTRVSDSRVKEVVPGRILV